MRWQFIFCVIYPLSDGKRARAVPQAEYPTGAEYHGAATEAKSHRQRNAPRTPASERHRGCRQTFQD